MNRKWKKVVGVTPEDKAEKSSQKDNEGINIISGQNSKIASEKFSDTSSGARGMGPFD